MPGYGMGYGKKTMNGKKKKLYVHHIRKWASASSLRFDVNNGITLCYNCHKEVTGNEGHYEGYLLGLIDG